MVFGRGLGGGGGGHWYDFIFIALAAAMVYPDRVLLYIGESTGWAVGWRHVVMLEVVVVNLLLVAMEWLQPIYPELSWWYPLVCVGGLAVVRGLMWLVTDMANLGD